jgi:hypothetical protein
MYNSVKKRKKFTVFVLFILIIGIFTLTACDLDENLTDDFADQDTYEAKLDEAIIEMDAGNYQTAKDILDDLLLEKPGDNYLLELRASCSVGIAGIDSLSAIEKIDNVADAGDLDAVDIIATILGDSDGNITASGISDTLDNLDAALTDLNAISNPTEDQLTQIALFSAYRVLGNVVNEVMDIASVTTLDLDTDLDLAGTDFSTVSSAVLDEIATDFTSMFNIPSTNALYDPISELADGLGTTSPSGADIQTWLSNLTN